MKLLKMFPSQIKDFGNHMFIMGIYFIGIAICVHYRTLFQQIMWKEYTWYSALLYEGYLLLFYFFLAFAAIEWKSKNLLWMALFGIAPAMCIQTVRGLVAGDQYAKYILTLWVLYGIFIISEIINCGLIKKKVLPFIRKGLRKVIGSFCICVLISGITSMHYKGTTRSVHSYISTQKTFSREFLWRRESKILYNWKEEVYDGLTDPEKEELYQKTVDLECEYWGINPVSVCVEKLSEGTLGQYEHVSRTATVSEVVLDLTREEALGVLLHETQHSYAHDVADSVDWGKANSNLLLYREALLLKSGFDSYTAAEDGFFDYHSNPVEVSARNYAELWTERFLAVADSL